MDLMRGIYHGLFFSLLFWGFVFGPVGTILAIPLTLTVNKLRQRFS